MPTPPQRPTPPASPGGPAPPSVLRETLARDGPAALAASLATVAVELGVYFAVRAATGELFGALACLAASAVWVAAAAPAFAADARGTLGALLRGGIVADASAVALIVLWVASPYVSLLAAVEVYLIYAAMALLAVAAVRAARSRTGRCAAAVLAAAAMMLALATPFWMGGLLRASAPPVRDWLLSAAVKVNGFYSITAAVFDRAHFVWDEARFMYGRVQQMHDYVAPSARWYSAAAVHAVAAALLAATHLVRRRRASGG
jgi:hypothetical protein